MDHFFLVIEGNRDDLDFAAGQVEVVPVQKITVADFSVADDVNVEVILECGTRDNPYFCAPPINWKAWS